MSEKIIEKKNKQMNMKYRISEWTSSLILWLWGLVLIWMTRLRKRLPIDEYETAIRQRIHLPLNIGEIEWPLRISKLTEPSFNLNVLV